VFYDRYNKVDKYLLCNGKVISHVESYLSPNYFPGWKLNMLTELRPCDYPFLTGRMWTSVVLQSKRSQRTFQLETHEMAATVSSIVFARVFRINDIDKEGKKFDNGSCASLDPVLIYDCESSVKTSCTIRRRRINKFNTRLQCPTVSIAAKGGHFSCTGEITLADRAYCRRRGYRSRQGYMETRQEGEAPRFT
jgi:hypothetical protein